MRHGATSIACVPKEESFLGIFNIDLVGSDMLIVRRWDVNPALGVTWGEGADKSRVLSFVLFMEEMPLSDFVLRLLKIMMLGTL